MTLIKDGRKPLVSSWQKYWLQLWGSSLVYFRPKPLGKNRDRRDFKSEPCKLATVEGWMVMLPEAATKSGDSSSFQLADPVMRNVYRFRDSGCDRAAWVYHLTRCSALDVVTKVNLLFPGRHEATAAELPQPT